MRGLIGKKMGMTRIYDENGLIVPVTLIQAGPCTVTQIKTDEKDGYEAVQVGYGERIPKHKTKPKSECKRNVVRRMVTKSGDKVLRQFWILHSKTETAPVALEWEMMEFP